MSTDDVLSILARRIVDVILISSIVPLALSQRIADIRRSDLEPRAWIYVAEIAARVAALRVLLSISLHSHYFVASVDLSRRRVFTSSQQPHKRGQTTRNGSQQARSGVGRYRDFAFETLRNARDMRANSSRSRKNEVGMSEDNQCKERVEWRNQDRERSHWRPKSDSETSRGHEKRRRNGVIMEIFAAFFCKKNFRENF